MQVVNNSFVFVFLAVFVIKQNLQSFLKNIKKCMYIFKEYLNLTEMNLNEFNTLLH